MPETIQIQFCTLAAKLLAEKQADTVLGFGPAGPNGAARPLFAKTAEEAKNFVWHSRCTPHLAVYLPSLPGKTAVLAKPCDVRALVIMLNENRLRRENLFIISFACPGIQGAGGALLPACARCEAPAPPLYDLLLEDTDTPAQDGPPPKPPAKTENDIAEGRFWRELDKCILCYACREACPGCGCAECFAQRGNAGFLAANPGPGDKMIYHLGRAMHLAGRCAACGACDEACALGVDVAFLRRAAAAFIKEEYGFTAGCDPNERPALQNHSPADGERGFHGGGQDG